MRVSRDHKLDLSLARFANPARLHVQSIRITVDFDCRARFGNDVENLFYPAGEWRPPFACRVEEILDVIAESRAAIEINGDPYRLDMEPRWIREARQRKIKFVISTDAHSTRDMNNLKFGIGIARRGWVRRGEVLNTLSVSRFQKAVRPAAR